MSRPLPLSREARLDALFACPLIHDLAADVGPLSRRPRRHPVALHLAFGAMARLYHSGQRLDAELAHGATWDRVVERYNKGAALHPLGIEIDPNTRVLTTDTYRHVRRWLTTDENLGNLQTSFITHSVEVANSVGLLLPHGQGSRTRPHPSRTIYGDGTIVRPLYNKAESGRQDLDADEHSRHDGQIYGNDLVAIATRGPGTNQRVILAVGRVHKRGREAATAVELIRDVHAVAGDGIQAVVYDGAFRGVHHETLMTELGLIVVNKVHATAKGNDGRTYRKIPLGQWSHEVKNRSCDHTLVVCNGSVFDSSLDDGGALVLSEPLPRRQVRRYERSPGKGWRFTLGVEVPCPKGSFTAWISPHRQKGERGFGRTDQLRLLPESDDHFQTIYGLRNDSESINSAYKRTLVADRAAARGWRRQVLDLMSWALLTNSLAWHQHSSD